MPSLADLYLARGRSEADSRLRQAAIEAQRQQQSGQAWGNTLASIGQTVAAIPGQIQEAKDAAQRREMNTITLNKAKREESDIKALDTAMQAGSTLDAVLESLTSSGNGHLAGTVRKQWQDADLAAINAKKARTEYEQAEADYFGSLAASVKAWNYDPNVAALAIQHAAEKGHDVSQIQAVIQQNPDSLQQVVDALIQASPTQRRLMTEATNASTSKQNADVAKAKADAELPGIQADATMKQQVAANMQGGLTADQRADNAVATQNAQTARISAPNSGSNEPLMAIMGPDGQAVYVPRSQAIGQRPANTREQGRPVTSGDAGRLADFDTSINDIATLRKTVAPRNAKGELVEPGATGTAAQIGAALPNAITNLTGWGTTAKEKQAVIDRVKQVIGKALEGGVLRKEDEYKYTKILPTIGDPVQVVEAKLNGLDAAIKQRKQTTLDALEDAGYEVSRYRERQTNTGGPVTVKGKDGQSYTFPNQKAADDFKAAGG